MDIVNPPVTSEPSKGLASFISLLVTVLGIYQTAHPSALVARVLAELPWIGQALPVIVTLAGVIYCAASSAIPQLRALFPWKPVRLTTKR